MVKPARRLQSLNLATLFCLNWRLRQMDDAEPEGALNFLKVIRSKRGCWWNQAFSYWCLAGNGWEWGHGIIISNCCGSFPHSLLGTSKFWDHVHFTPPHHGPQMSRCPQIAVATRSLSVAPGPLRVSHFASWSCQGHLGGRRNLGGRRMVAEGLRKSDAPHSHKSSWPSFCQRLWCKLTLG